jgi:prolipoprotein diacylglyceryltransferase
MRPSPYYWYIWTAAGFAGYAGAVYVLRRRHACTPATVAAVVAASYGLWIGAKWHHRLEHYPALEALMITPRDLLTSGMRIPLGLVVGALVAALVCRVFKAPWRETGDALAVAASTLILVGRFGCFVNGCCMGTTCPIWAHALCPRFGPGTETYDHQVVLGLITSASPTSLPAHPLPLYFGAASGVTLIVLLWLLRRGAPAGALLVTFCLARPLTKLSLELLRVTTPGGPTGLMLGIPLAVLLVTSTTIAVQIGRRVRGPASSPLRAGASRPTPT